MQFAEQRQHGGFLFQCPCVHGDATGRQSSLIADADGMPVVVLAMCTDLLQRTATMDFTIARDVEMITDVTEATVVDVVVAAGLKVQVPPLGGGGTMDDDERYSSHAGHTRCNSGCQ